VRAVLGVMRGVDHLVAQLLYGSGLRLLEALRLRVKDVDLGQNTIVVRGGKGDRDRVTMLSAGVKALLVSHLERVRAQHQRDLAEGAGWVELPGAFGRKSPAGGGARVALAVGVSGHAGGTRTPRRVSAVASIFIRRASSGHFGRRYV
jgi:integrase